MKHITYLTLLTTNDYTGFSKPKKIFKSNQIQTV